MTAYLPPLINWVTTAMIVAGFALAIFHLVPRNPKQ